MALEDLLSKAGEFYNIDAPEVKEKTKLSRREARKAEKAAPSRLESLMEKAGAIARSKAPVPKDRPGPFIQPLEEGDAVSLRLTEDLQGLEVVNDIEKRSFGKEEFSPELAEIHQSLLKQRAAIDEGREDAVTKVDKLLAAHETTLEKLKIQNQKSKTGEQMSLMASEIRKERDIIKQLKKDREVQEDLITYEGQLPERGFIETFRQADITDPLPFVSGVMDVKQAVGLYQAAQRLEEGTASEEDILQLVTYQALAQQDASFGGIVADIVIQAPAFAGELLLTSGAFTKGKAVTKKAITDTLSRVLKKDIAGQLTKKGVLNTIGRTAVSVGGGLGGAAFQFLPSGTTRIPAQGVQNMLPELGLTSNEVGEIGVMINEGGDKFVPAMIKAMAAHYVEVASEHAGEAFTKMFAPLTSRAKAGLMKLGFTKAFFKVNDNISNNVKVKALRDLAKKAGWNGLFPEYLEERVADVGHGALFIAGLGDQEWSWPSLEQSAAELVGFGLIGTGQFAAQAGTYQATKKIYDTAQSQLYKLEGKAVEKLADVSEEVKAIERIQAEEALAQEGVVQPGVETVREGTQEVVRVNGIATELQKKAGETNRFNTIEDVLKEIDKPKQGKQGLVVNATEAQWLINHFNSVTNQENIENIGKIYTPFGAKDFQEKAISKGGKDVIIGQIGNNTIVAEIEDGKFNGRIRMHSTPIEENRILGRIGTEGLLLADGKIAEGVTADVQDVSKFRAKTSARASLMDSLGDTKISKVLDKTKGEATDKELADAAGITIKELKFRVEKAKKEQEKRSQPKTKEVIIKETIPGAARVMESGINVNWKDLSTAEQKAVELWIQAGNEGLPAEVRTLLEKRKGTGRDVDFRTYLPVPNQIDKESPSREYETKLMLNIKEHVAVRKLAQIADYIGSISKTTVRTVVTSKGQGFGRIEKKADGSYAIFVRDLFDYSTLGHEIGHLFDRVILLTKSTVTQLYKKAGLEANQEAELVKEIKGIIDHFEIFNVSEVTSGQNKKEMFAEWFTSYLTDYNLTKLKAPTFTEAMEKNHPEVLQIKGMFEINPEDISYKGLPTNRIKAGMNNMLAKIHKVEVAPNVEIQKYESRLFKRLKGKIWSTLGSPFWKPQMIKIWKAITDNAVYGYNGALAVENREFDFPGVRAAHTPVRLKAIAQAVYFGNDPGIQKYLSVDELRNVHKLTDSEIETYKKVVEYVKNAQGYLVKKLKSRMDFEDMTTEQRTQAEQYIEDSVKKLGGYIPIGRSGEWAVYGEQMIPGRKTAEPFFNLYETENEARTNANTLSGMKYENISVYNVKKTNVRSIADLKKLGIQDLEMLAHNAGIEANNVVLDTIKQYIREKTFQKNLIHRQNVPGFDRTYDNLEKSMHSFMQHAVRSFYFEKARIEATAGLNEIDMDKDPETYAMGRDYIEGFFNSSADEMYALRKGIYIWYLTFKTSFLIQNLLQPFITQVAETANYSGGIKAPIQFIKSGVKARKYLLAKMGNKKTGIEDTEIGKLMRRLDDEKVISGTLAEHELGNPHERKDRLGNALGFMGNWSEAWNRIWSAFNAYEITKDTLKMTDTEEIYEFMKNFVNRTHFPYGKHNLPGFVTGAGKWKGFMKSVFIFKTWIQNYFHFFNQRVLRGSAGARVWGISNLIFFAGIMGLPFMALIKWLIRKLTGRDMAVELRKKLGPENDWIADTILHGVPTQMNMNLTNMVGAGDIISPSYDPLSQVFGAAYGLADKASWGIKKLMEGDTQTFYESISPTFLRNIIVADRWRREGIRIDNFMTIEPTQGELLLKSISFTPNRISEAYNARSVRTDLQADYAQLRNQVVNYSAKGNGLGDVKDKFGDKIDKHNEKAEDYLYIIYVTTDITNKAFNSAVKSVEISSKDLRGFWEKGREEYRKQK